MSRRARQDYLLFSASGTGSQAIVMGLVGLLFAYEAYEFSFNFAEFSATHHSSPRYAWFEAIADSNGGVIGAIFFILMTLLTFWYVVIAAWQFFTDDEAATLTERGLVLHRTFWRPGEIPYSEVLSAEVGESSNSGWLFKRRRLLLTFANRRAVRLASLTTDGGTEALRAFARELNARRKHVEGSTGAVIPPG